MSMSSPGLKWARHNKNKQRQVVFRRLSSQLLLPARFIAHHSIALNSEVQAAGSLEADLRISPPLGNLRIRRITPPPQNCLDIFILYLWEYIGGSKVEPWDPWCRCEFTWEAGKVDGCLWFMYTRLISRDLNLRQDFKCFLKWGLYAVQ